LSLSVDRLPKTTLTIYFHPSRFIIVPQDNALMNGTSSIDNALLNDFGVLDTTATSPILGNTSNPSMNDEMFNTFQSSLNMAGRSKATPMQIRCKFGSLGPSKGQFNSPHGFCLGLEQEIVVADTNNHRIQVSIKF
jgi:hypothetical protein